MVNCPQTALGARMLRHLHPQVFGMKYSPLFQVFVGGVGGKVVPKMLGHGSN